MSISISLSADIIAFSLTVGTHDDQTPPRSIGAVMSLHDDDECPLELDADFNPYALPLRATFRPGEALLLDGTLMADGCGALSFNPPFTSHYADIEPVPASLSLRISLPTSDFDALWSTFATGRPDLVAIVQFETGPFEQVLPPAWRWNTAAESHLRVTRASITFATPGWPGRG